MARGGEGGEKRTCADVAGAAETHSSKRARTYRTSSLPELLQYVGNKTPDFISEIHCQDRSLLLVYMDAVIQSVESQTVPIVRYVEFLEIEDTNFASFLVEVFNYCFDSIGITVTKGRGDIPNTFKLGCSFDGGSFFVTDETRKNSHLVDVLKVCSQQIRDFIDIESLISTCNSKLVGAGITDRDKWSKAIAGSSSSSFIIQTHILGTLRTNIGENLFRDNGDAPIYVLTHHDSVELEGMLYSLRFLDFLFGKGIFGLRINVSEGAIKEQRSLELHLLDFRIVNYELFKEVVSSRLNTLKEDNRRIIDSIQKVDFVEAGKFLKDKIPGTNIKGVASITQVAGGVAASI